jgi:hypothetical protein
MTLPHFGRHENTKTGKLAFVTISAERERNDMCGGWMVFSNDIIIMPVKINSKLPYEANVRAATRSFCHLTGLFRARSRP